MSKGIAVALIIGQMVVLVGRLSLVVPAAFYHRHRAVRAFDGALRRCGVPAGTRRALRLRYQEMVPLNPLRYRSRRAGPPDSRPSETTARHRGGVVETGAPDAGRRFGARHATANPH